MKLIAAGRLSRCARISSSALLHHESAGLLHPASRTEAGCRLYSPSEIERLRLIRAYREAGLSLAAIAEIIVGKGEGASWHLERRFLELNEEIAVRREQQCQLAKLAGQPSMLKLGRSLDRGDAPGLVSVAVSAFAACSVWSCNPPREPNNDPLGNLDLQALRTAADRLTLSFSRWAR